MSKTEQAFHLGKLLSEAKELASRLPVLHLFSCYCRMIP